MISLAAVAGRRVLAGATVPEGECRLRFGLLSDSHVSKDPETHAAIRSVFKFLASRKVDAVCHAGDIVEVGDFDELKVVTDAWQEAFPGGKNVAGGKVTPFFVFGNHDYHDGSKYRKQILTPEQQQNYILWNKDRAWKMLTGEEKHPGEVFARTIKGYTFFGAHWKHEGEIAAFLKEHPLSAAKPAFHVRHPHPLGTCYGAWASGVEKGCEELLKHPNVWVMSGHSHLNVGNDRAIWQGGFVSMGSGSSYGTAIGGFGGEYDNTSCKKPEPGQVWHSPMVKGPAWQTSVISVYDDYIYVERFDLKYDEKGENLGEPWKVEFPFRHDAKHPYLIADAASAPGFGEGVKISFREERGLRRPEKVKEDQLIVSVSEGALSDGDHSRPGFYRFELLDSEGRAILTRSVVQNKWSNNERRAQKEKVECHFGSEEVRVKSEEVGGKSEEVRARVTPMNASGKAGAAILSGAYKLISKAK